VQYSSDYASLIVNIFITKEFIQDKKYTIVKNSKKEKEVIIQEYTKILELI